MAPRRALSLGLALAFSTMLIAWDERDTPTVKSLIAASARYFKFESVQCPDALLPSDPWFGYRVSEFRSINEAGMIAGAVARVLGGVGTSRSRAILYSGGKFTLLNPPLFHGDFSTAIGVNNRGQVLVAQGPHYFLYDTAQQTYSPISPFVHVPGGPPRIRAEIIGMNDQGQFVGNFSLQGKQVAGFGQLAIGAPGSATVPDQVSEFTVVACPNNMQTEAKSINNRGQITGSCAAARGAVQASGFIYSNGAVVLFTYPDSIRTVGMGINDAGLVVGTFSPREPGPGMTYIEGFAYDGSQFAPIAREYRNTYSMLAVDATNNKGQIIGMGGGEGLIVTATPANPLRIEKFVPGSTAVASQDTSSKKPEAVSPQATAYPACENPKLVKRVEPKFGLLPTTALCVSKQWSRKTVPFRTCSWYRGPQCWWTRQEKPSSNGNTNQCVRCAKQEFP